MTEQRIERAEIDYQQSKERLSKISPELSRAFPEVEQIARPESTVLSAGAERTSEPTRKLERSSSDAEGKPKPLRGNGRIFLRGQVYWIAYSLRGKEYRESAKTDDEKKAGKFLQHRLKEIGADQLGLRTFVTPRASRLTIHDLLEALRSDFELRKIASPQNLCTIRKADADFGAIRATNLTAERVDAYIERRQNAGAASATINRITQIVKQAYGLAIKREHLFRVPSIRHLSEAGNARKGFFSEKEFRSVLVHLPAGLADFALFAYLTGWRRGEIASLTWSDVEDKDTCIRLRAENSKNGVARAVPLVGELADIIKRRRHARRIDSGGVTEMSRFVFHRGGTPIAEFRKSWASACVAAGAGKMICPKCQSEGAARKCPTCEIGTLYSGRLFHDLRRSAVRRMVRAGVPQQIAKKISGHKTDSMFQRYAIIVESDLREALQKTQEYKEASDVVALAK